MLLKVNSIFRVTEVRWKENPVQIVFENSSEIIQVNDR